MALSTKHFLDAIEVSTAPIYAWDNRRAGFGDRLCGRWSDIFGYRVGASPRAYPIPGLARS